MENKDLSASLLAFKYCCIAFEHEIPYRHGGKVLLVSRKRFMALFIV